MKSRHRCRIKRIDTLVQLPRTAEELRELVQLVERRWRKEGENDNAGERTGGGR